MVTPEAFWCRARQARGRSHYVECVEDAVRRRAGRGSRRGPGSGSERSRRHGDVERAMRKSDCCGVLASMRDVRCHSSTATMRAALLERILENSPAFFEQLLSISWLRWVMAAATRMPRRNWGALAMATWMGSSTRIGSGLTGSLCRRSAMRGATRSVDLTSTVSSGALLGSEPARAFSSPPRPSVSPRGTM